MFALVRSTQQLVHRVRRLLAQPREPSVLGVLVSLGWFSLERILDLGEQTALLLLTLGEDGRVVATGLDLLPFGIKVFLLDVGACRLCLGGADGDARG